MRHGGAHQWKDIVTGRDVSPVKTTASGPPWISSLRLRLVVQSRNSAFTMERCYATMECSGGDAVLCRPGRMIDPPAQFSPVESNVHQKRNF